MVSVNVAQLLQMPAGAVRDFDFDEPLPDPSADLHLVGPVHGHAHLVRTSRGILVHADFDTRVALECARCLDPVQTPIEASLDEEFLPTTDVRTGTPLHPEEPIEPDQPTIDEHHELDLDEILRQNLLTAVPLRPLCDAACPGLCPTCGARLDPGHPRHTEPAPAPEPADTTSPFARLAGLFQDNPSS